MAILSMFYSLVIPIETLSKVFARDELQEALIKMSYSDVAWFDDYLYRQGSMSPLDNDMMIEFWKDKGLVPIEIKDGQEYWKDLCLIDIGAHGPTLPCDWIEVFRDDDLDYMNLKGKPRGIFVKNPTSIEEFISKLYDSKGLGAKF